MAGQIHLFLMTQRFGNVSIPFSSIYRSYFGVTFSAAINGSFDNRFEAIMRCISTYCVPMTMYRVFGLMRILIFFIWSISPRCWFWLEGLEFIFWHDFLYFRVCAVCLCIIYELLPHFYLRNQCIVKWKYKWWNSSV